MNAIRFEPLARPRFTAPGLSQVDAGILSGLALPYLNEACSAWGAPSSKGLFRSIDLKSTTPAPAAPPIASPNSFNPNPAGADLLVIDYFQSGGEADSSDQRPSHGAHTSYVAGASSDPSLVDLLGLQATSNREFADQLNAIAASSSPPEVISLSIGLDPATVFLEDLPYLNSDFEGRFGTDRSQWDESAWSQYKERVQKLIDDCSAGFEENLAGVPDDVKAALQNLVNAGVTVTIAGGNEGSVKTLVDELGLSTPTGFFDGLYLPDLPAGVIVVGASESNAPGSAAASFTDAKDSIDVAADGTDVKVSADGQTSNGTSFSAPYVAGLVADMKALDPTLTPAAIEEILMQSADSVEGEEARLGSGIVNREKALAMVRQELESVPLVSGSDNYDQGAAALWLS